MKRVITTFIMLVFIIGAFSIVKAEPAKKITIKGTGEVLVVETTNIWTSHVVEEARRKELRKKLAKSQAEFLEANGKLRSSEFAVKGLKDELVTLEKEIDQQYIDLSSLDTRLARKEKALKEQKEINRLQEVALERQKKINYFQEVTVDFLNDITTLASYHTEVIIAGLALVAIGFLLIALRDEIIIGILIILTGGGLAILPKVCILAIVVMIGVTLTVGTIHYIYLFCRHGLKAYQIILGYFGLRLVGRRIKRNKLYKKAKGKVEEVVNLADELT